MFCPYYPVQEVWEWLLSKVFDAWSLKMIQRNSGEGCIDENAPSAASHDSFQRVHIAYWSHWSQLTMSMADRKFNQMNKLIANILLLSCPCPACNLITWIRLKPNEICVELWFVSHCTLHMPIFGETQGWCDRAMHIALIGGIVTHYSKVRANQSQRCLDLCCRVYCCLMHY